MRTAPAWLQEFSVSRVIGLNINTCVLLVQNTFGGGRVEVYIYEESQFSMCVNVYRVPSDQNLSRGMSFWDVQREYNDCFIPNERVLEQEKGTQRALC